MIQIHAEAPWRVGDAGHTVFGPPNGSPSPVTIARQLAKVNAARIVACVNACEGLANEDLDDAMRGPSVAREMSRLRAENAELVAALIDARNGYRQLFDVMPVAWQTYANIIDSAIAKAGRTE